MDAFRVEMLGQHRSKQSDGGLTSSSQQAKPSERSKKPSESQERPMVAVPPANELSEPQKAQVVALIQKHIG